MITKTEKKKLRRQERKRQRRINVRLKKQICRNIAIAPCYYCKLVFVVDNLTIEHIKPLSFGGTNDANNIALSCGPCNHSRGRESFLIKKRLFKKQYEKHTI